MTGASLRAEITTIRIGGACTLLGVATGLAGAAIGAIHGLGAQTIALGTTAEVAAFVNKHAAYLSREWWFLPYAIFAVGEGVGLYYLTRSASTFAFWGLIVWSIGALVGVVQDAALVGFVRQFPVDYTSADASTRLALEAVGRTTMAMILVQQGIANTLLGCGGVIYSAVILQTGVASRWFGGAGIVAALAGVFFGVVTAAAPRLAAWQPMSEQLFGLVVLWDVWAGLKMLQVSTERPHRSPA